MMRGGHCRCLCVIIFPGTLLTRTYELWYGRPHMTNSDQLWPPEYVISLSDNYIDSTLLPASYDIYVMWGGHCRCLCVIIWPGTLWTRTYELWYGRPHLTTSDHIWPPEYYIRLPDNDIDRTLSRAWHPAHTMWGGHCRCLSVSIHRSDTLMSINDLVLITGPD
jgi:hypothetical protein